jgi:NhaP-type Na+/H+ or K+/H+ antiporter
VSHDYDVFLLLAGLAVLGLTVLPRLLVRQPLTVPVVLILLGLVGFGLPVGLEVPDPLGDHAVLAERVTELGVIIALTGCGLKLDRPFEFRLRAWRSTWLLLGITMPLSIMASAALGWMAGLPIATAVLLGAVIAPTDPVLASDVQVGPPQQELIGHGEEDEVRFSLTAEAGLNDGLAFPFTNAAILMVVNGGAQGGWISQWLLVDVVYKTLVGVVAGVVIGWLLAKLLFATVAKTRFAEQMEGLGALAITLVSYGVTELAGGYGFIAVFVAALVVRACERNHEYHHHLHDFAEDAERLLMAAVLVGLGGAITGGLLAELDWMLTLVGLAIVFLVRPVAGMIGLLGQRSLPWAERWGMSFFGIRGIGSLYYLIHARNEAAFLQAERLWALVIFVVLVSVIVHGLSAKPVMHRLDQLRADQMVP